ncbi:transcriptional regulator [Candidatus Geothermarchaeota archaeon ex4572_27]|nr:MAG: transcriptional regulator [Candidatus Geothermarchaeota archaeon ex4572_27]
MPEIEDWRSRIDRYRFRGYRCPRCGRTLFMKRYVCPNCGHEGLEPFDLPRRGRIAAYSIVRQAPELFKKYEPYPIALIELEDGMKVVSQVTDVLVDEVKDGMEVEATFRILYEYGKSGHIVYGVKFRPAWSEGREGK